MLDLTIRYPGQVDETNPNYPWGKPRNQIADGDGIGTPWERDLASDIIGALHATIYRFGVRGLSGSPENISSSQFADVIDYVTRASLRAALAHPRTVNAVDSGVASGDVKWVPQAGTFAIFHKEANYEYIVSSQAWNVPDALPALEDGIATAARAAINRATGKICVARSSNTNTEYGRLAVGSPGSALTNVTGMAEESAFPFVCETGVASPEFVIGDGADSYTLTGTTLTTIDIGADTPGGTAVAPDIGAADGAGNICLFERGSGKIWVSHDSGENWTFVSLGDGNVVSDAVWSQRLQRFVAVGVDGSNNFVVFESETGDDGSWDKQVCALKAFADLIEDEPITVSRLAIVGGQMLVAYTEGAAGSAQYSNHRGLWYSFDAVNWTLFDLRSGGSALYKMAGGDGSLVTIHEDGTVKMWGQL